MITLKSVNKAINEFYPWMELVKGDGYFYFIPRNEEEHKGICENLLLQETTSVYVNKLSDLSSEDWVIEARKLYVKMIESVPKEVFIVTNNKKERRYTDKEFSTHKECWAFICNIYETSYQGMEEDLYVGRKE